MPVGPPNFSPYPWGALRSLSREDAAIESLLARWFAIRHRSAGRLAALLGPSGQGASGPIVQGASGSRIVQGASGSLVVARARRREPGDARDKIRVDPNAALAEVRVDGHSAWVACSSTFVREVAQTLLGGPAELAAPRALTPAENSVFALVVAAALEDGGLRGEVWPVVDPADARRRFDALDLVVELDVRLGGDSASARAPISAVVALPGALRVSNPGHRDWPSWPFDLSITVGACVLHRDDVANLRVRDVITLERRLALRIGPGDIVLEAKPGAVEAKVAIGYVPRPMQADDAQMELTVQLGTTRLTLRQLAELAPGAIVSLGRPLAGPFEVRAQGRLIGQGELVDVDGELGVRIVTLQE